jgi:hypothetical protein
VLIGDLHDGFETHKIGNTTFCSPGSLARLAISDQARTPSVAIVKVKDHDVDVEVRPLTSVKRGKDVFDEDIAGTAREMPDQDSFVRSIEQLQFEAADIHELLQKVGKASGWKKEVLDYLEKKRMELLRTREKVEVEAI